LTIDPYEVSDVNCFSKILRKTLFKADVQRCPSAFLVPHFVTVSLPDLRQFQWLPMAHDFMLLGYGIRGSFCEKRFFSVTGNENSGNRGVGGHYL
jgi:hypothetical protein